MLKLGMGRGTQKGRINMCIMCNLARIAFHLPKRKKKDTFNKGSSTYVASLKKCESFIIVSVSSVLAGVVYIQYPVNILVLYSQFSCHRIAYVANNNV